MMGLFSNKLSWSGLLILLMAVGAKGQQTPSPRTYVAHKATESIAIDGKANEAVWQKARWSQDFIDIEGQKTPTYKTNMKMLWDDTHVYFYAWLEEPHIWGTLKQRDTVIFYNNDFEIFIDPDGDTHNYMEFEMNALNTLWDLYLTKPYRNHGKVLDSWNINGIKTAVHIDGTLNDPSDMDNGWGVEIAMPWSVLTEAAAHGKVPQGEFWRFGFSRVNWDYDLKDGRYSRKKGTNGKFLPEYNWVWSPQWVINMHEPERWGYVYFSPKAAGETDAFTIPQEESVKWYLYDIYRKERGNFYKKAVGKVEKLSALSRELGGKTVTPELERHSEGWNLSVLSPFSGKKMVLREDGKFISHD